MIETPGLAPPPRLSLNLPSPRDHPVLWILLTDALAHCRQEKALRLHAYVLMDNHLHLLATAPDLSGVLQSFKRFTARKLMNHFRERGKTWLLNQLSYHKKDYKTESDHQFWQEGSHPKQSTAKPCSTKK